MTHINLLNIILLIHVVIFISFLLTNKTLGSAADMVCVLRNRAKHDVKLNVEWRMLLKSLLLAATSTNQTIRKIFSATFYFKIYSYTS